MRILIADDHPLTLYGTKSFVESYGYKVEDTCSNGISSLNLIMLHQPDIAVLDINMPGLDGLDVAKKVQENKLKTKIILLTMHKELTIYNKAAEYGVYGYILKENAQIELEVCLREVVEGRRYHSESLQKNLFYAPEAGAKNVELLTLTEKKIVEQIIQQKTSREIASILFLSEKTVEGHRTKIIEKLGLPKEKNALLKWALQNSRN